jgi:ribosomal protein L31
LQEEGRASRGLFFSEINQLIWLCTTNLFEGMNMATLQITCINKTNRYDPHERILNVGGTWGKKTQPQAIIDIESKTHSYWTHANGKSVWVIVAVSRFGNKYLKTENDGDQPDNLLSLPECR